MLPPLSRAAPIAPSVVSRETRLGPSIPHQSSRRFHGSPQHTNPQLITQEFLLTSPILILQTFSQNSPSTRSNQSPHSCLCSTPSAGLTVSSAEGLFPFTLLPPTAADDGTPPLRTPRRFHLHQQVHSDPNSPPTLKNQDSFRPATPSPNTPASALTRGAPERPPGPGGASEIAAQGEKLPKPPAQVPRDGVWRAPLPARRSGAPRGPRKCGAPSDHGPEARRAARDLRPPSFQERRGDQEREEQPRGSRVGFGPAPGPSPEAAHTPS